VLIDAVVDRFIRNAIAGSCASTGRRIATMTKSVEDKA
jgi:hypothetical protein